MDPGTLRYSFEWFNIADMTELFFASQRPGFECNERELGFAIMEAYADPVSTAVRELYGEERMFPEAVEQGIDTLIHCRTLIPTGDYQRVRLYSRSGREILEQMSRELGKETLDKLDPFIKLVRERVEERCKRPEHVSVLIKT